MIDTHKKSSASVSYITPEAEQLFKTATTYSPTMKQYHRRDEA